MHEFAIAQSLVEAASAEAQRAGAQRVIALHCRIGVLRQVNDDVLREAFAMARAGTRCADSELRIDKTYMRANCQPCNQEFAIRDWNWTCPRCGAEGGGVSGGDELELISIEAEVDDEYSGAKEHL